jgi:hypothetical protein
MEYGGEPPAPRNVLSMRRPRLAAVTAVCILAGAVVTDVALGSPPSSVAAASDAETERSTGDVLPLVEHWADLDDWSSVGVGVSRGRLHGAAGSPAGAFRGLSPAVGSDLYVRGSVSLAPGGVTGTTTIGVSLDAPGAEPSSGRLLAIGFDAVGRPVSYRGAAAGGPGTVVLDEVAQPPGRYWVTVSADAEGIGLVMTNADGSREWRWAVRADDLDEQIGNVAVWNSDLRGPAGSEVMAVGYDGSVASLAAAPGLGGHAPIVVWGWEGGTRRRLSLPADHDPAVPVPLVLFAHGSRQTETAAALEPIGDVSEALLDAGYAVASSEQHGTNWGNPASVRDLESLYRYVDDLVGVDGPVFLLAQSMGGLSSLTLAAEGRVPVAAWAGIYPATNLGAAWDSPGLQHDDIANAFGISPTRPDDYDTRTYGSDPMRVDPARFEGIAMRFYASQDDTVIPPDLHSEQLMRRLAGRASEAVLVPHIGQHGDPSAFRPADVVAFFDRHR